MVSVVMFRLVWLVAFSDLYVLGETLLNVTFINGNVSCTILHLSNDGDTGNYPCLSNSTEELIFKNASVDALDLTEAMRKITPWKVLISESRAARVVFPAQMTASVVHLVNVQTDEVLFEENGSVQDFRADYTSLQTVPPTVTMLPALDILWVTHSELTAFSFDMLENSSIYLLYLVANRIETVAISAGRVCCTNLEEIFLSSNRLKRLDFGTFALMAKLKTIFLEDNQLAEVESSVGAPEAAPDAAPGPAFCSWRSYYAAQVQSDAPDAPTPHCVDYFATLLSIHLARNRMAQVNFRHFSLMNSLNSLDLSDNVLTNLTATANEVPIRLSELFVSNNNITEVYLAPFASLNAVYLYDNELMELNMSSLPKEIDYLNLLNNPLDCNALPHMNRSTVFPAIGPYTEC